MTEKSSPAIASTVLKVGQKRQHVKTNQTISNLAFLPCNSSTLKHSLSHGLPTVVHFVQYFIDFMLV